VAGFHYFRNRSPVSDRCNLIFFQPNIVPQEGEWLNVLRVAGRKMDKGKKEQREQQPWKADYSNWA